MKTPSVEPGGGGGPQAERTTFGTSKEGPPCVALDDRHLLSLCPVLARASGSADRRRTSWRPSSFRGAHTDRPASVVDASPKRDRPPA